MGEIEDSPVNLNDGESKTVILKRDPSKDGNVFGGSYPLYFYYFTTSGSSTLTLQKDPSLKDMSYFIQGDIRVSGNSHLIMNLNSTKGNGLLRLEGAAMTLSSSTVDINDVNKIFINSSVGIQVNNGSTLNINNVDSLINVSSTSASASIYNNNSTLYIEADVYNYDKNSLEGGGNFTQISNNAKTTIGVLFIILVLIVVSKAEKKP